MRNIIFLVGVLACVGGCAGTFAESAGDAAAATDNGWVDEQRARQAQIDRDDARQAEIQQQLNDQAATIELNQRIADEQQQAATQLQNDQQMLQTQMQQSF